MQEKKTGRVEIADIEPNVFKKLLHFINFGEIDSNDVDELLKLTVAADKYGLKDLVRSCSFRILLYLSAENVVDVLVTADLVKENTLKKECAKFFVKNKSKIVESDGYKNTLVGSRPDLLFEIFQFLD